MKKQRSICRDVSEIDPNTNSRKPSNKLLRFIDILKTSSEWIFTRTSEKSHLIVPSHGWVQWWNMDCERSTYGLLCANYSRILIISTFHKNYSRTPRRRTIWKLANLPHNGVHGPTQPLKALALFDFYLIVTIVLTVLSEYLITGGLLLRGRPHGPSIQMFRVHYREW